MAYGHHPDSSRRWTRQARHELHFICNGMHRSLIGQRTFSEFGRLKRSLAKHVKHRTHQDQLIVSCTQIRIRMKLRHSRYMATHTITDRSRKPRANHRAPIQRPVSQHQLIRQPQTAQYQMVRQRWRGASTASQCNVPTCGLTSSTWSVAMSPV